MTSTKLEPLPPRTADSEASGTPGSPTAAFATATTTIATELEAGTSTTAATNSEVAAAVKAVTDRMSGLAVSTTNTTTTTAMTLGQSFAVSPPPSRSSVTTPSAAARSRRASANGNSRASFVESVLNRASFGSNNSHIRSSFAEKEELNAYALYSTDPALSYRRHLTYKNNGLTPGKILAARRKENAIKRAQLDAQQKQQDEANP